MTITCKDNFEAVGNLLSEYLEKSGYVTSRIAVEINENILPKSEYTNYVISENDKIEVVSFVGGG